MKQDYTYYWLIEMSGYGKSNDKFSILFFMIEKEK